MKRTYAFTIALLILLSPVFASNSENGLSNSTLQSEFNSQHFTSQQEHGGLIDCTFNIKGTFDGVKVDLRITVYDISIIECGLLKLGVKDAMK